MKIGIISYAPETTSGFGLTCRKIASGMLRNGHTVSSFSVGDHAKPASYGNNSFKIWHSTGQEIFKDLPMYLKEEGPDILFINYDIKAATYFIKICRLMNWKKKIFAHVVIDGFPVQDDVLQIIREVDGIIVPTKASKKYLRSEGIRQVHYAPHGVDRTEFFPLNNKSELRSRLGIKRNLEKTFIIGVFAKNTERKQIPKVLLALHHLVFNLKQKDILLYLHTQVKSDGDAGWDLEFLVNYLKLDQYVIFTAKKFQQDHGIERTFAETNKQGSKQLNYIERINMCDLVVNVPFSGGFELCNIEAQACGVPIITIDDNGNIKEVVGASALLIKPAIKNFWKSGAEIFLVDETELAAKILEVKNDTELKISLINKGHKNTHKFTWTKLDRTVERMISGTIKMT